MPQVLLQGDQVQSDHSPSTRSDVVVVIVVEVVVVAVVVIVVEVVVAVAVVVEVIVVVAVVAVVVLVVVVVLETKLDNPQNFSPETVLLLFFLTTFVRKH